MVWSYKGDHKISMRLDLIARCENHIDGILSRDNRVLHTEDSGLGYRQFKFELPTSLTETEAKFLKSLYVTAGWQDVEVLLNPRNPCRYSTVVMKV